MILIILYSALFLLFYTWIGYLLTIKLISLFRKTHHSISSCNDLSVTIIVVAHNEEKNVISRIDNLTRQTYDHIIEIIILSDGSTDRTVELARSRKNEKIIIVDSINNVGRASMHNYAVEIAKGEILIFSDAETKFDENYVSETIKRFYNKRIGCVVGNLVFVNTKSTSVSQGENIYWKYDLVLRRAEEDYGILANATGAAMAIRKTLYKKIRENEDIDTATPIDIALAGKYVIYANNAIAYDFPPATIKGEYTSRIRGAAQTINCIIRRLTIRNVLRRPSIYFGLFWHRICRYLTFPLMMIVLLCSIWLVLSRSENSLIRGVFFAQIVFYMFGAFGALNFLRNTRNNILDFPFNFMVSVIAMAVGFFKGVIGRSPSVYKHQE